MINVIYAALPMHAKTKKTTFSCKDNIDEPHTALDIFRFAVFFFLALVKVILNSKSDKFFSQYISSAFSTV